MAHGTSFTSVMVSWQEIPENHIHGILKGYVVKFNEMDYEFYGCTLNKTILDLEKSKVYKLQVAGFTSKGHGNFSDEIIVTTDIDGIHFLHFISYCCFPRYRTFLTLFRPGGEVHFEPLYLQKLKTKGRYSKHVYPNMFTLNMFTLNMFTLNMFTLNMFRC